MGLGSAFSNSLLVYNSPYEKLPYKEYLATYVVWLSFLVRSYGTENRPTERPIPPRNETYEFIIFNGPDIKDIFLGKPSRQMPTLASGLPKDPAILQVTESMYLS